MKKTQKRLKNWIIKGMDTLPKITPKDRHKQTQLSIEARNILWERGEAKKDRNIKKFEEKNKEFRKHNTAHNTQRTEHGIWDTEHIIQNTKYRGTTMSHDPSC